VDLLQPNIQLFIIAIIVMNNVIISTKYNAYLGLWWKHYV